MLIMTARVSKIKIALGILAVAVVICAACFLNGGEQSTAVFEAGDIKIESGKMSDEAARGEFLTQLGWEVEPHEFMEVMIPREFDDIYSEYNELQKSQGMDLTKYRGKRAMHYTYKVKNHPSGEDSVVLNLLVYKNKLIGGDVCSTKADGFMHGLAMP